MNQKKKIAIINSVYGYGSTGRICAELAAFLDANNFESIVFYGRNKSKNNSSSSYYFGNKIGMYLHALFARLFDSAGLHSKFSTIRLVNKLKRFNPDLIVLNNLHGYYLNYKILLRWIAKNDKKTLCVFHDCWNFTGHCAHFDYLRCSKWKTVCKSCPGRKEYPCSIGFDKSTRNYLLKNKMFSGIRQLKIITPSLWLAGLVKESFLKDKEVVVINNGIDIDSFQFINKTTFRQERNLSDKRLILCITSIFDKKKGLLDILELSKKLQDNERIVMVGKINAKISLPKNIVHITRTNSVKDLAEIYSSCDVMFNPTYEDTYPTTNLEALSCKLPVVCYKTGGAIETIDKNFIVEKGDVETSYLLCSKLFNGEIHYGFQDFDFSKEKMHKSYLKIINSMLCE